MKTHQKSQKYLPHAIILDIKLPGIDGWTVLNKLKSKSSTRHIPIHMMSAEEETIDAFKKGENGYIVLEIKNTNYRKKTVKMHLYQAACYALMVEEEFGRVDRVVLRYQDKEVSFPFTSGIKKYCISIINKIRKIAQGELVTYRYDKKRCLNCGYFKFCRGI